MGKRRSAPICNCFHFPTNFQLEPTQQTLSAARAMACRVLFKASQASDVGSVPTDRRSERVVDRKVFVSTSDLELREAWTERPEAFGSQAKSRLLTKNLAD